MKYERAYEVERILLELTEYISEISTLIRYNYYTHGHLPDRIRAGLMSGEKIFGKNKRNVINHRHVKEILKLRLESYGINPKSKGHTYIEEAVIITMESMEAVVNLQRSIYPKIASRHKPASPGSVEHAIRNAIRSAYKRNSQPAIDIHCDMFALKECPSNKEFIMMLVQEIKLSTYTELLNF